MLDQDLVNLISTISYINFFFNGLVEGFFISHYLKPKYRYSNIITYTLIFVLTIFQVAFFYNNIFLKSTTSSLLWLLEALILYDGKIHTKISIPFIMIGVIAVSELIVTFILFYVLKVPVGKTLDNLTYFTIAFIVNVIMFGLFLTFIKFKPENRISKRYQLLYLLIIMSSFPFTLAIVMMMYQSQIQNGDNIVSVILLFSLDIILSLFMLKEVNHLKNSIKQELVNQATIAYYQQQLNKYIEIKNDSNDYHKIRHDLINYIERIKLEDK